MSLELRAVPDPDGWAGRLAERVVTARTLAQVRRSEPRPGPAPTGSWRGCCPARGCARWSATARSSASPGWAATATSPDVYDAWLDDPADGPALLEAVLDAGPELVRGPAAGGRGRPGTPAQRAMVDGGGFTLMASNLRLDLDGRAGRDR